MKKRPANADAAPLAAGVGLVALDIVFSENRLEKPRYLAGGMCGKVFVALRDLEWQSAPIAILQEGAAANALPDAPSTPRLGLPLDGCKAIASAISSTLVSLGTLLAAYELSLWRCGEDRTDMGIVYVDFQEYDLTGNVPAKTTSKCYTAWLYGECYAPTR